MYHVTQVLVSNEFPNCIRSQVEEATTTATTTDGANVEAMETNENEPVASSKPREIATRKEYIFGEVWRVANKKTLPWSEMKKIDCEAVWEEIREAT